METTVKKNCKETTALQLVRKGKGKNKKNPRKYITRKIEQSIVDRGKPENRKHETT